jgi:hypothetical protein
MLLRAAKANAQPFHIESSPARVSRRAVLVVPAIPSACMVYSSERPSSLAEARVDEIEP